MTDVNTEENIKEEDLITTDVEGLNTETEDLEALKSELNRLKKLVPELRKYEKSQKAEKEKALAEQGKYQELYEAEKQRVSEYENKFKSMQIESILDDVIKQSKVKYETTVKALIKREEIEFAEDGTVDAKSIKKQIDNLYKTQQHLFELPAEQTPTPRRTNEDSASSGYEIEIRKAKTRAEITEVMKKYGKIR